MFVTPEMIREQRFKVKLSGFDKDEVIHFLMELANDLETLIEDNAALKDEVQSLRSKQTDLEELFLSAKKFSDEKLDHARGEARRIMAEAEHKAQELLEAAKLRISQAEHKARELQEAAQNAAVELKDAAALQTREILSEVEKSKATLEREVVELRTRKKSLFSELTAVIESQRSWIRQMSDVDSGQE